MCQTRVLASCTVTEGTRTCAAAPWRGPRRQRLPPRRREVHAHDTSTPIRHSLGLTSRAGMACKRPRPAVCTVGSRQAPDTSRLLAVNICGNRVALLGARVAGDLPCMRASGGLFRERWRERAQAWAARRARTMCRSVLALTVQLTARLCIGTHECSLQAAL